MNIFFKTVSLNIFLNFFQKILIEQNADYLDYIKNGENIFIEKKINE